MYTYIDFHVYTYAHIHVENVYTYLWMRVCTSVFPFMYVCMDICIYMCLYARVYVDYACLFVHTRKEYVYVRVSV